MLPGLTLNDSDDRPTAEAEAVMRNAEPSASRRYRCVAVSSCFTDGR